MARFCYFKKSILDHAWIEFGKRYSKKKNIFIIYISKCHLLNWILVRLEDEIFLFLIFRKKKDKKIKQHVHEWCWMRQIK